MKTSSTLLRALTLTATLTFSAYAAFAGGDTAGGGYGNASGKFILNRAQNSLLTMLHNASEEVFRTLPTGTREKLISALSDIQQLPEVGFNRDGTSLMFDYAPYPKESKLEKIKATRLFFDSHAAIPIQNNNPSELNPVIAEAQLLLLHEAAHMIGVGRSKNKDHEARGFANELIEKMSSEYSFCVPEKFENKEAREYFDTLACALDNDKDKNGQLCSAQIKYFGKRQRDIILIYNSKSKFIVTKMPIDQVAHFNTNLSLEEFESENEISSFPSDTAKIGDFRYDSYAGVYLENKVLTKSFELRKNYALPEYVVDLTGRDLWKINKRLIRSREILIIGNRSRDNNDGWVDANLHYDLKLHGDPGLELSGNFSLLCKNKTASFDTDNAKDYAERFRRDGY
jgi:hypothetical protein